MAENAILTQCTVPQNFILLPFSVDKAYHKQEVRFVWYLLGQIVT